MKRMWIGVALLAVLLVSGLLAAEFMEKAHGPIASDLEQAADAALEGSWGRAEALTARARKSWDKHRFLTAAFADHGPMEEIEAQLAKIETFAAERNRIDFCAGCAYLARILEALGESHSLNFRNLM